MLYFANILLVVRILCNTLYRVHLSVVSIVVFFSLKNTSSSLISMFNLLFQVSMPFIVLFSVIRAL